MKRYTFIFVILFILFFSIKVEAVNSASLSIKSAPEETNAGESVTLSLNVTGKKTSYAKLNITFNYDNEYLQLVGFEMGSDSSCSYSSDMISCTNEGANIVYPVFVIKKALTTNQSINAIISESYGGGSSASAKATIQKKEKIITVTSIEVNDYKNTLSIGETSQLIVSIYPENAKDKSVTYTSSDNNIITVSESGLVTATGEGDARVIIKSGSIEKSVNFTVMKDPIELKDIKVKEKKITLKVGDKKKLVYTLNPTDASVKEEDIIIKSSDENVVIIDKDLNIHAMNPGTAKITISAGLVKTEVDVNVEGVIEKKKSSSALGPCIITAIVTFVLTVIGMFVLKLKKGSGGPKSSPSINENGDFNFDM